MDQRSPTFEATLLYKTAPALDYPALVAELRELLADHGMVLTNAERIDGIFTLLTCDTLQILLAVTETPLPVEHFLDAHRPASDRYGEVNILRRLQDHKSCAAVLVLDAEGDNVPFGQAFEDTKRVICWEIAECLSEMARPELIFWCDSDTLYAADEFQRASLLQDEVDVEETLADALPRTAVKKAALRAEVDDAMLDWAAMDRSIEAPEPMLHARRAAPRSGAMLRALSIPLDRLQERFDRRRLIHCVAMGCSSTTIGLNTMPSLAALIP